MHTRRHPLAVLLIAVLVVTSCVSSDSRLDRQLAGLGLRRGENNSALPIFRINGWSRLDERNLLVVAGANDNYLVELNSDCPMLEGAFRVGFVTPTDVDDRFESILIRAPGRRIFRCDISDITRLRPI